MHIDFTLPLPHLLTVVRIVAAIVAFVVLMGISAMFMSIAKDCARTRPVVRQSFPTKRESTVEISFILASSLLAVSNVLVAPWIMGVF